MVYLSGVSRIIPDPIASRPEERSASFVSSGRWSLERSSSEKVRRRSGKIDRFVELALETTSPLIEQAITSYCPDQIGIIVGNMLGGWEFAERELRNLHTYGSRKVSPHQATAWFPAAAQGEVSIANSILGYSKTLSGGLACGLEAMVVACDAILLGKIKAAIVGVAESLGSSIALAGVSDVQDADVAEGACFFLLTERVCSNHSVPISVDEAEYNSVSDQYEFSRESACKRLNEYVPFHLDLQPLLDVSDVWNEVRTLKDPFPVNLAFVAGKRRFVMQLGSRV